MFVPVSCTACGKPFQVPDAALGKLAPCPWCQTVVTALPVSDPAPVPSAPEPLPPDAGASAEPAAPEPLSLDDDPPNRPAARPRVVAAVPVRPPRARTFTLTTFIIGGVLVVVAMVATVLVSGRTSAAGWTEFTAPDGSFTAALPGTPEEEEVGANPDGSVTGGKRYVVRGWHSKRSFVRRVYSRTGAWVAYTDLTPALVQKLPSDKQRVIAAGVLRVERDREVIRLNGTITKEAEVAVSGGWGIELQLDTPDGTVIERMMLMSDGPRPRLYTYGVQGSNLTPTSPECVKLFGPFRVNN